MRYIIQHVIPYFFVCPYPRTRVPQIETPTEKIRKYQNDILTLRRAGLLLSIMSKLSVVYNNGLWMVVSESSWVFGPTS